MDKQFRPSSTGRKQVDGRRTYSAAGFANDCYTAGLHSLVLVVSLWTFHCNAARVLPSGLQTACLVIRNDPTMLPPALWFFCTLCFPLKPMTFRGVSNHWNHTSSTGQARNAPWIYSRPPCYTTFAATSSLTCKSSTMLPYTAYVRSLDS